MMNPHDGNLKYLTSSCPGCPHLLEGQAASTHLAKTLGRRRLDVTVRFDRAALVTENRGTIAEMPLQLCTWGVALKILVRRVEGARACEYRRKPQPPDAVILPGGV